jgi:Transcriptional regulator LmrA/YxaF-like, C-terminal domain
VDEAAGWGARALLREFVEFWERLLSGGDFTAGCPVVAAAIGSDDEPELSVEAGVILGRWCTALTRAFVTDGFEEADAASLAVMSIAALEGAIVLCRSTRNAEPLHQVGEQLEFLVKAREFVICNGIPGKHDDSPNHP